jgi:CheY-like chemotaxis protein
MAPPLNTVHEEIESSDVDLNHDNAKTCSDVDIRSANLIDNAEIIHHFVNKSNLSDSSSTNLMSSIRDSFAGTMMQKLPNFVLAGLPIHILVVDDASSNRKMLARMITRDKHTYAEAEDGVEAVKMVALSMEKFSSHQNREFDAIFMDYTMPKMDGPEASLEIRNLGYKGFIYGVTGNVMNDDVNKFISMGADKVLAKPLSIAVFRSAVTGFII